MERPRRVLVVEDDVSVSAGIVLLLGAEGIESEEVTNGAHVSAAIMRIAPGVVLLDVDLPDMSGVDVYRQIAAEWPQIAVVFVSGHATALALSPLLSRPEVAFLPKPFEFAVLLQILERAFRDDLPIHGF